MTKYHDIVLTNIQLHTIQPRKPRSFLRTIFKSLRSGKPGRVYSRDISIGKNGEARLAIPLPPDEMMKIEEARKAGKIIRFFIPKTGLPVFYGKDLIDRIEADKRRALKRI